MPDIEVRRPHALGLEAARAAANRMVEDLGRKFGLRAHWDGNVLRFDRPGVNGALALAASELHLTVSLGFLLKAMKGSIERSVIEELDKLFSAEPADRPAPPADGPSGAPGPKTTR